MEAFSEYYYATLLYINVKLSNTSDHHYIMAGAAVTGGSGSNGYFVVLCSASSVPQPVFTITVKAPTRAFSWLKAPASAFTFKTLLRHYANWVLTPWSLNVKLGLHWLA